MLRLLYYRYKKSGKISTKKGGGLIIRHGRIIHILRYMSISASKAILHSKTCIATKNSIVYQIVIYYAYPKSNQMTTQYSYLDTPDTSSHGVLVREVHLYCAHFYRQLVILMIC